MAEFKPIWALGCMSGTSMDGVDVASICTDGVIIDSFGRGKLIPFTDADRGTIAKAVGVWPDGDADVLTNAAEIVHKRHVEAIKPFASEVELVGFHGQTVNHDPKHHRTFQIGDGRILARLTGLKTVWDFRSLDMTLGGQGAPLAPFFHFACAKYIGAIKPFAFLNLGGVGNVTFVDPSKNRPEDPGALLAFDTGPANALIDDFVHSRTGAPYDVDGALAAKGRTSQRIVNEFLDRRYFATKPPKSLDRNQFQSLLRSVEPLSTEDGAATLTTATVLAAVHASQWMPKPIERVLVAGGGRKNKSIMAMLPRSANFEVEPVEAVGLDGDMLEAQAFAYLAVRHLRGLPTAAPGTTGCRTPNSGGRIASPEQV